jgi:uncharacterized membrane protein YgcG
MKILGLVVTVALVFVMSQTAFALPERVGQINDFAEALSDDIASDLDSRLANNREASDRDIIVLIVRNMEGMNTVEYDDAITEAWGLDDRHVLILVSVQESAVRISVGNDVKSNYPDELMNSVVSDMIPFLADGRFDSAVNRAVNRLLSLQSNRATDESNNFFTGPVRIIMLGGILAVSLIMFLVLSA